MQIAAADAERLIARTGAEQKFCQVCNGKVFGGCWFSTTDLSQALEANSAPSTRFSPASRLTGATATLMCCIAVRASISVGDWSMGFADFSGAGDILKGFVRLNEQLRIKELDGSQAMELLATCGAEGEIRPSGA